MKRVGFVGTENSHTDDFIRFLNIEDRHEPYRVTALAGGRSERNEKLAATTGVSTIVERPEDLIDRVDAVIISSRDGSQHKAEACPLITAGIPVLVDKPLAASVGDAEAILDTAAQSGVSVLSASAMRFVPEVTGLLSSAESIGRLRQINVVGPADPDSSYSGLFFYGIHHVEAALELLGNPVANRIDRLQAGRRDDLTTASFDLAGVQVNLTFITPADNHRVPFHASLIGADGVAGSTLVPGRDYNAPALQEFVNICEGKSPRLTGEQLLAPVKILSAIVSVLEGQR
ncbi:Gfo/Idh/MocA family oxidoreductase [Kribbella sp. NPDC050459]|uniref:Gfo/Idh/MocA family protein n=1 Tax=Kribbella sp. NPDC050459 TaxID=3155785 RepID=UPI0033E66772